eukprot:3843204-Rhodomonas_salina.1
MDCTSVPGYPVCGTGYPGRNLPARVPGYPGYADFSGEEKDANTFQAKKTTDGHRDSRKKEIFRKL